MKYQAWRSVYSIVASYVQDERLRQALSFHLARRRQPDDDQRDLCADPHDREGRRRLVRARRDQRAGRTAWCGCWSGWAGRCGSAIPALKIEMAGDRVTGVTAAERLARRGRHGRLQRRPDAQLQRCCSPTTRAGRRSPSACAQALVALAVRRPFRGEGRLSRYRAPQHPLRTALQGTAGRYLRRRRPRGFLALSPSPEHHRPRDGAAGPFDLLRARPGRASRQGKGRAGTANFGDAFRRRDPRRGRTPCRARPPRQSRHAFPLHSRRVSAAILSAHLGSAFSLEPVLWQSAWFRAHNRDDAISNLYFVGAGTHPGAGIPGVVGSAKATANLMLEDI